MIDQHKKTACFVQVFDKDYREERKTEYGLAFSAECSASILQDWQDHERDVQVTKEVFCQLSNRRIAIQHGFANYLLPLWCKELASHGMDYKEYAQAFNSDMNTINSWHR